jgi:magnesium transporter
MQQLRLYGLKITPDWIDYALIDDIVDSFMPVLRIIELEVDAIDDLVLILKESEQSDMLRRIGHARKKVNIMLRLLSTKPDVIRTLIKRVMDRFIGTQNILQSANQLNLNSSIHPSIGLPTNLPPYSSSTNLATPNLGNSSQPPNLSTPRGQNSRPNTASNHLQPKYSNPPVHNLSGEVGLYLGDIQDHAITMVQNLAHYEKTLGRSHSNYLAQISIELTQASNSTNDVVMRMTALASVLLPMNVITGLWGMNVKVPGEGEEGWFYGIALVMLVIGVIAVVLGKRYKLI